MHDRHGGVQHAVSVILTNRRRRRGGSALYNPATSPNIYSWIETKGLGLANNAAVASIADQSAGGHGLTKTGAGNGVYKTNVLNGYGVVDADASAGYDYGVVTHGSGTVIILARYISGPDTNDMLHMDAVATRLRLASPGNDWYANSASGIVAVGGTQANWQTIVIRWATTPGPMVIRMNGVQKASFNPHGNWYGNRIMNFVCGGMVGQFAAAGRWSTDIGDTQVGQVEATLKTVYAHY